MALNCVTSAAGYGEHASLLQLFCAAENVARYCHGGFDAPNTVCKNGGGICMRPFGVAGPWVQQPSTVTAYPMFIIIYGYFSSLAAGWEFFALDRDFDENGKISIFM